ncbi:MAG: undecaprenyl-diphosphate phosphatase [Alphaproteobacteria bacterium]|nr:undecaprenyl-diphosphate phosphatase [Alphaproteobacteria bacterium]
MVDIQILILSLVQGIAEFLPISSSINLELISKLFDISLYSFHLKIALHAGSLLALLIYFQRDIKDIFYGLFTKKTRLGSTLFFPIFVATIPVIISGYFSVDFIEQFNSIKAAGILSIIFGILLCLVDRISGDSPHNKRQQISVFKSFIIGCFQAIAIIPGVSRLGITITAARMLSLDRSKSIRFAMILAIPSIAGSLFLEVIKSVKYNNFQILEKNAIIAMLITALVSLIFIHPALNFMARKGFFGITIYRIIIGLVVLFL